MLRRRIFVVLVAALGIGCPLFAASPDADGKNGCPGGMARIEAEGIRAYCIDRWEASVVEIEGSKENAHAGTQPVTGLKVKAISRAGVTPQGYISKNEAEAACKHAKKRLCTGQEWERACKGKKPTTFPYGDERKAGYCNDSGKAPISSLHPDKDVYASHEAMNDPRINQAPNTVAPTGKFEKCRNGYGVYDMVGNLHEWTADVHDARGTFRGGYYQDTHINGDGCGYRTSAHGLDYHDYSTGFRCCAEAK